MFHRLSHRVQANLEEFYDEDVGTHLHPVRLMFYSALIIGIMALAVSARPMDTMSYSLFVVCYTIYYLSVAITMINYIADGAFFVQASGYEAGKQTKTEQVECDISTFVPTLKIHLNRWIEQKLYLKNDTSTDLIARQLGVTRQHAQRVRHDIPILENASASAVCTRTYCLRHGKIVTSIRKGRIQRPKQFPQRIL